MTTPNWQASFYMADNEELFPTEEQIKFAFPELTLEDIDKEWGCWLVGAEWLNQALDRSIGYGFVIDLQRECDAEGTLITMNIESST